MSEPVNKNRPEFRDYRPTKYQMAHWLNAMALLYNDLHKNDPEWIHPMRIVPLPEEIPT
jgi:hypothetical protein